MNKKNISQSFSYVREDTTNARMTVSPNTIMRTKKHSKKQEAAQTSLWLQHKYYNRLVPSSESHAGWIGWVYMSATSSLPTFPIIELDLLGPAAQPIERNCRDPEIEIPFFFSDLWAQRPLSDCAFAIFNFWIPMKCCTSHNPLIREPENQP